MNYLGLGVVGRAGARLVSSCKDLYNDLNGANLTGAVDVVVVKQMDGTYKATPFHVRFGKWGVLRTGDLQKEVEVEVNGEAVHNRMMLDESGSAFFVKPKHSLSIDEGNASEHSDIMFQPRSHSTSSIPDPIIDFPMKEMELAILEEDIIGTDTHQLDESFEDNSFTGVSEGMNQDTGVGVAHVTNMGVAHGTIEGVAHGTSDGVIQETSDGVIQETSDGVIQETSDSGIQETSEQRTNNLNHLTHNSSFDDDVVLLKNDNKSHNGVSDISEECSDIGDVGDEVKLSRQSINYFHLQISKDKHDKKSVFLTPTDNLEEFDWLVQENTKLSNELSKDLDSGVLSDSVIEIHKKKYRHVNSALSDSELDEKLDACTNDITKTKGEITSSTNTTQLSPDDDVPRYSLWGAIRGIWSRKERRRFSSIEEGIYLDDLDNGGMADEERALYLPSVAKNNVEEDMPSDSSGVDTLSPLFSPVRQMVAPVKNIEAVVDLLSDVQISRCELTDDLDEQLFSQSLISFEEFCSNPDLIATGTNTIVKISGKYYSWSVAAPMIMAALLYQQPLPDKCQSSLEKRYALKNKDKSRQSLWRLWSNETADEKFGKTENNSTISLDHDEPNPTTMLPPTHLMREDPLSSDDEEPQTQRPMSRVRQRSLKKKRFIFTNELTSEELSRWPLKPGKNELVFSITTKYQGTARANCSLYLWNYDEKIVVSDFDGTITRSDVAGQVLPFLGKDWTHFGVIELFSAIQDNGYKFLYLSARAIGQSMYTKNYLKSTHSQDCHYLPDGPLLVTPFSLYKAFKKEVIERKPEEFKILCLQQIRTFFPDEYNPFHAGFGNKPSDAKSYLQVNIYPSRIYTVNPKGQIKNELSWTFQSSYIGLMELFNAQFPSLLNEKAKSNNCVITDNYNNIDIHNTDSNNTQQSLCVFDDNFSSFLYWQHSLNSFDSIDLPEI